MRIALTLSLDIDRDRDRDDMPDEPSHPDLDSVTEHAEHDSTPRLLGFQPDPRETA